MLLLVITIIGTFVGTVAAVEFKAWAPYVSRRLLRSAIARFSVDLPAATRERWTEEIEADLESLMDRPLAALVFALRLRLRGGRGLVAQLEREQAREVAAAATRAATEADDEGTQPRPAVPVVVENDTEMTVLRTLFERYMEEEETREVLVARHHPGSVARAWLRSRDGGDR
jgi:hypothetical protein